MNQKSSGEFVQMIGKRRRRMPGALVMNLIDNLLILNFGQQVDRVGGDADNQHGSGNFHDRDVFLEPHVLAGQYPDHPSAGNAAVGMHHAEAVGEKALDAFGGHAHEGHHPHPEDRAGAAVVDRRRHAGDVADADGRGERGGERLKMGEVALFAGAVVAAANDVEGVAEPANLHPAQVDGEKESRADQQNEKRRTPHDAAGDGDGVVEGVEGGVHEGGLYPARCRMSRRRRELRR